MEIIIAATKTCPHRPLIEKILKDAWLLCKAFYFENHPELIKKYKLKHSPLLIVEAGHTADKILYNRGGMHD